MTGVEKVRELAARLAWVRKLYEKERTGDDAIDSLLRSHIHRLCLAYGSYLRGIIDTEREWHNDGYYDIEPPFDPYPKYNASHARDDCEEVIAAWKETLNAS